MDKDIQKPDNRAQWVIEAEEFWKQRDAKRVEILKNGDPRADRMAVAAERFRLLNEVSKQGL